MRRALLLALGTALVSSAVAFAAPPAPMAKKMVDPTIMQPGWVTPKTSWGAPDLGGYWTNATLTPLTRNSRVTPNATITEKEARATEAAWADALAAANSETKGAVAAPTGGDKAEEAKLVAIRPDFAAAGGDVGGYNAFWLDPGSHIMEVNGEFRTSIITTPNGLPPARKASAPRAPGFPRDLYDSYENRSTGERCITSFGRNAGPPMLTNGYYNNDYQILQTPTTVVIHVELVHEARVVRLGGTHRTDGLRPMMGDSIGHYEGNTLVVETTNLPERDQFMGAWKDLKVTEWFTRVSPTRVNYRFQVESPDVWEKPWGGEYNFYPMTGIIYEYACHEGNYALPAILAGARQQEAAAAGKSGGTD